MKIRQGGGTFFGLILGIVAGLGVAFAVASYIGDVPVPFVPRRENAAEQDAREQQRNRNWNPNALMQPSAPPTPQDAAAPGAGPGVAGEAGAGTAAETSGVPGVPGVPGESQTGALPQVADVQTPPPAIPVPGAPQYFVQAGAFRSPGEAQAQRARVAMLGWEARVSELEQNGSTLYRVRVGPFARRDDAEQLKQGLDGAGVVSTLVRASGG